MQQTIPVNDGYISSHVGTTPSTGPFAVDFPFFSLNDVVVSRMADGTDIHEDLVRGADYDITGVATEDGSFSSGSVTLYIAVSNSTVTRFRTTPIERLSNFPLQGFFSRLALNAELNRVTVWMQELHGLLGTTSEASQAHAPIVSPFFVGDPRGPTPVEGDNDNSLATTAFVQNALVGIGAAIPTGTVIDFAGATAPNGWLVCAGQAVSKTVYPGLWTAIGAAFNVGGEASTDFRVPDLRGRVTAGPDGSTGRLNITNPSTVGAAGGEGSTTLTVAQLAAHTHNGVDHLHAMADHTHAMSDHAHRGSGGQSIAMANAGNLWGYLSGSGNYVGATDYTGPMDVPHNTGLMDTARTTGAADRSLITSVTGSTAAHNTTQATMVLNKIIKT